MTLRTGESVALPAGRIGLTVDRHGHEGAPHTEVCALVVYGAAGDEGGGGDGSGGRYGGDADDHTGRGAPDLVHAGAPVAEGGALRHEGGEDAGGEGVLGVLTVDLAVLPAEVAAVVLLARATGGGPGAVPATRVRVTAAAGAELACYDSPLRPGRERADERVRVLGACVRDGHGWRFRTPEPGAVGEWADGHRAVAEACGLPPAEVVATPEPDHESEPDGAPGADRTPGPPGAPAGDMLAGDEPSGDGSGRATLPPAEPAQPAEVRLTRRAPAVTLASQGAVAGTLRLSLDLTRDSVAEPGTAFPAAPAADRTPVREQPVRGRIAGRRAARRAGEDHGGGDVRRHGGGEMPGHGGEVRGTETGDRPQAVPDLCALFELSDGGRGVVQALGGATGSLREPPYIRLDGADTGAGRPGSGGTSVVLNLDHADRFRRVLFFLTVQPEAAGFAGLHAAEVTLRPDRGAAIRFDLDVCADLSTVCALALLQRDGPDLVVRREARYLVPPRGVSPQRTADYAYGWGLTWRPFA